MLLGAVPTLTAISGLYLPEEGVNALVQEFREEMDGSISVPLITSGFSPDPYVELVMAGEMDLHGVFSHFIHPDDVLDEERGALLGWERMKEGFEGMLREVTAAYPALCWCTATEGSAAVQRYDRVGVKREWRDERTLVLTLSPFTDEAWLCLHADRAPESLEGAEIFPAGNGWWLRADADTVTMR